MKKVITYGTFDLIHRGHINILQKAKEMGDYLIVAVSTDDFNSKKNKNAYHCYNDRKIIMESIRDVDLVIPEKNWDQKINDIKSYNVDIFVIGDEWRGEFDYLSNYCQVLYLPHTPGISTTKIKSDLSNK